MLISVISMTLFATSQPRAETVIEYIIPATMGIYILQSFAISFLSKIALFHVYPALLIPIVFIICMIVVEIALKIPVVNRLFKL